MSSFLIGCMCGALLTLTGVGYGSRLAWAARTGRHVMPKIVRRKAADEPARSATESYSPGNL